MYLSKLTLDISAPSVRQGLRNCQDMHRSLMKAFDSSRADAGMLYRVVAGKEQICVYVLSAGVPAWERVAAQGYRCMDMRDVSGLSEKYREGAVLRFTLLACPSKKVKGEGKNSQRVLLTRDEERMDWLARQGEKYGFDLLEAHVAGKEEKLQGSRPTGELMLTGVPYEGVLRIREADLFWQSWVKGIGPEKAYGMGLMLLSRC